MIHQIVVPEHLPFHDITSYVSECVRILFIDNKARTLRVTRMDAPTHHFLSAMGIEVKKIGG